MKRVGTTLTLFLYGTLRYGQPNFQRYLGPGYMWHAEGRTKGALFNAVFHGRSAGYPLADFTAEGTIVGDLMTVHVDRDVLAAVTMEMNAGYDLVVIDVDAGDMVYEALAFHMDRTSKWGSAITGERVPTGNWLDTIHST